jgi:hypothetical protein
MVKGGAYQGTFEKKAWVYLESISVLVAEIPQANSRVFIGAVRR